MNTRFTALLLALITMVLITMVGCAGPGHQLGPQQYLSAHQGPVVTMQGYVLSKDEGAQLERNWADMAQLMRRKEGFRSAKLHRGVDSSTMWVSVTEWDSLDAVRQAFADPAVRAHEERLQKRAFEHVFVRRCDVGTQAQHCGDQP
ncbi:MAG: antibiotic biosynthesis monooxygenase family protein [Myxococcota bacterium]